MFRYLPLAALFLTITTFAQNTPAAAAPPKNGNAIDLTLTSLDSGKPDDDIPFEALKTFVDVFDTVKSNYIETISNEALMEKAIRGMLVRLDPHSVYMNDKEYQDFEQQSDGQYAGIGVVLDIKAGSMRVVSAIEGSPAARAGIQSGDIIAQVNGQNVADLTLNETAKLLNGEAGTEVKIIVQRGDSIVEYSLLREIIATSSVSSRMLNDEYAYLRISQFQDDTTEALEKEVAALRVKHTLRGAIIDLRNNPGGYLDSAVATADLFLNSGPILYVRGRDPDQEEQYLASDGDILAGLPIVVLVDEGSASGSEIVAGALQDQRRAVIVGQPTFGKGSVQTVIPLYHGGAVKLTTAHYYTPSGNSIQAKGITPQVILTPLRVQQAEGESISERESSLPYHLVNPAGQAAAQTAQNPDLATQDFALYEALNVLKTMAILQATIAPETQLPANGAPGGEQKADTTAAGDKPAEKTENGTADKANAPKIPAGFGR
ncbi:S41 family peptidase [uncultured Cardiobacterium sp.]|uniref:S41 family peptidase n=1 Tax=uncultured Cardiobacterium sp. TaxID=417619 RepID=UPI00260CFE51|nr:S41 family peptidase [uncultured Cardiobacterium sp.]